MKYLGDVMLAAICGLFITTAFVHMNNNTSVQSSQQEHKK